MNTAWGDHARTMEKKLLEFVFLKLKKKNYSSNLSRNCIGIYPETKFLTDLFFTRRTVLLEWVTQDTNMGHLKKYFSQ